MLCITQFSRLLMVIHCAKLTTRNHKKGQQIATFFKRSRKSIVPSLWRRTLASKGFNSNRIFVCARSRGGLSPAPGQWLANSPLLFLSYWATVVCQPSPVNYAPSRPKGGLAVSAARPSGAVGSVGNWWAHGYGIFWHRATHKRL